MTATKKDPTEPIRLKASRYPGVDEGTSCTQNSYKTGKNAFLYIGMQGGRYKAMFKLQKSRPEAARLAKEEPDRYQVGSTAWVTARFTADKPAPKRLWEKWLDESYELSLGSRGGRQLTTKKVTGKKTTAKKPVTKKTTKKKTATKKKGTATKTSRKKAATKTGTASRSKDSHH